jgi:hypothetical protein
VQGGGSGVSYRACDVVNQFCEAPPALAWSYTRATCFACGLPVCKACSSRRKYYSYGVKRICDRCQEERFGADHVRVRAYHKAGYKNVTLSDVRAGRLP